MSVFDRVPNALASALSERGFAALTPVQTGVLEPGLIGRDLIVSAQTGSGKTVAFGISIARDLLGEGDVFDRPGDPVALVVAPTRELALQVQRELAWLYAPAQGRVASCVGGMDVREERRALERGAHIVVGTPGRLGDHIRRGSLMLENLAAIVLDEGDEMLNLGFREELEFILQATPATRRTLMFSATMAKGVEQLARTYLRDPVRVNTVSAAKQHVDIHYRALVVHEHDAQNAIFNVLRFYDAANAIVFCATREGVNRMMSRFANRGFAVVALSGELSQKERSHALQAMRDHRAQVCVATDVAARGLDLPDLDLVIHADLPKNTEALLHRSGRTGRAGRKGASILIVPPRARRRIERLLQEAKVTAEWGGPPTADAVRRRDDERLLGDEALSAPPGDIAPELLSELLARHSPEQIAAAFIRKARKGMAAPEDIEPAFAGERASPARAAAPERKVGPGFGPADPTWMRLSVGRTQAAEPRWLIPMLCKAAGVTKRDLGAIRIGDDETMVEMSGHAAQALLGALGPDGRLEKNVYAALADGAPRPAGSKPFGKPKKRDSGDKPPARKKRAWTPHD